MLEQNQVVSEPEHFVLGRKQTSREGPLGPAGNSEVHYLCGDKDQIFESVMCLESA